jgi:hypothetical protein
MLLVTEEIPLNAELSRDGSRCHAAGSILSKASNKPLM